MYEFRRNIKLEGEKKAEKEGEEETGNGWRGGVGGGIEIRCQYRRRFLKDFNLK